MRGLRCLACGVITAAPPPLQVPHWVWLAWTPQLLMSLQRQEGPHARRLLLNIAQLFPQTIYYALRTMMLGLRDMAVKGVKVSFPLLSGLPAGSVVCIYCLCLHADQRCWQHVCCLAWNAAWPACLLAT